MKTSKRIISIILAMAMIFALAACGESAGGNTDKDVKDDRVNIYTQLTGIPADAVAYSYNGRTIPFSFYAYFNMYSMSSIEYELVNYYFLYDMGEDIFNEDGSLNWKMGDGENNFLDYAQGSAHFNASYYTCVEEMAEMFEVKFTSEDEKALEEVIQQFKSGLDEGVTMEDYLYKIGLTYDDFYRINRAGVLYEALVRAAKTEGSKLYMDDEAVQSYYFAHLDGPENAEVTDSIRDEVCDDYIESYISEMTEYAVRTEGAAIANLDMIQFYKDFCQYQNENL